MTPLVSVIIATFNRSNVLPFSVGSVLRQTHDDFEVLVIGDGCTDDSQSVVESIGDARVYWHNLPENSGHQSAANNEGLRLARGKYIAYLGHDDLWLPHHLESLVAELEQGADVVYGLTIAVGWRVFERQIIPSQPDYIPAMWLPPTGTAHRKSVTDAVGGWLHYRESNRTPEAELWLRAFKAGFQFACAKRVSAIKFPASSRKDVYKTQDCHEQAACFARMGDEQNFERTELVETLFALAQTADAALKTKPYRVLLREFARETRLLIGRRLRPAPSHKGAEIDAMRRYKGLESKTD